MSERFQIYRCTECDRIAEGWKPGPRYCAGNQWLMETPLEPHWGDHPSAEMEHLIVEIVSHTDTIDPGNGSTS